MGLTGWDFVAIFVGWCVASFLLGFIKALHNELKKADATFDYIVATAVQNFPNSYIWVRRGWLFFVDHIAVTIITGKWDAAGPVEDFVWNSVKQSWEQAP